MLRLRRGTQVLPAQSKHPYRRYPWMEPGEVGMLRLRSDDRFAIVTTPLSMTLVMAG